jgi:predicted transcriptional regulator
MPTPKQDAADLIAALPEDATLEDIQYRLYVLEKIRAGDAELEAGRGIDHADARAQMAKWRAG